MTNLRAAMRNIPSPTVTTPPSSVDRASQADVVVVDDDGDGDEDPGLDMLSRVLQGSEPDTPFSLNASGQSLPGAPVEDSALDPRAILAASP
jgi:hypothetical protein